MNVIFRGICIYLLGTLNKVMRCFWIWPSVFKTGVYVFVFGKSSRLQLSRVFDRFIWRFDINWALRFDFSLRFRLFGGNLSVMLDLIFSFLLLNSSVLSFLCNSLLFYSTSQETIKFRTIGNHWTCWTPACMLFISQSLSVFFLAGPACFVLTLQ